MEPTKEQLMDMYYYMLLGRAFEERLEALYRQGRIPGAIYLGRGQEASYIGSAYALKTGDVIAPTHRDMMAMLPRGMDVKSIMAQHYGKVTGPTRGRGEADYLGDLSKGIFTTVSMLPDFYPVAAGAALAFKYRGEDRVALAYCGDGATSRGDWHEALNLAAVMNLPVVFFVINNKYAYSTPNENEMKIADIADRAAGYGIPGRTVDGNDVLAVHEATLAAVDNARTERGPSLIEAKTMRMRGHAGHDPYDYVPKASLEEWEKKDPIKRYEEYLTGLDWFNDDEREVLATRVGNEIKDAVDFAEASPLPDPSEVTTGVYH
ncbi:MAG: thiamine pyrophosphate-dependent dehydrogenase E1 component subunit alpha [Actinomycetota bacterium]|nr:thiamine pyrophosphate-dependent dehydrogenase E1 component subunit alpha [Actinomycetota bacterium]